MSSILDALKKSEAERRNSPPGLNTPLTFAAAPPPRQRKPWLLPVVAIAALVLAWAGGLFDSGGDADPVPVADGGAESEPLSPVETSADGGRMADPQPAPPAAEPPVQADQVSGFGTRETPVAPSAAQPDKPAPFRPSRPGSAVRQPPPEQAPPPAASEPPPATSAPAAQDATTAAAPQRATGSDIPSLNDLPFATRKNLPALSMTMHLYSADPSRRLALINGVQARDGDELEGGIQIRAIRADGVVIVYDNTEFLLPAHN